MKAEVNIFNKLVEGIKAKGLEAQKILWDEIQLSTLNIESGAKARCPVKTGRLTIDPYTLSTKNAIRVTLTKRATLVVHAGDAYNFVKGVISTAKTALTAA